MTDYTKDCGDGSCILRDRSKPSGMRTNGGCQHLTARGPEANAQLYALGMEIVALRAAEAKLAALVEAHDAWKRYGNPTSPFDLDEAIRRIRGEP